MRYFFLYVHFLELPIDIPSFPALWYFVHQKNSSRLSLILPFCSELGYLLFHGYISKRWPVAVKSAGCHNWDWSDKRCHDMCVSNTGGPSRQTNSASRRVRWHVGVCHTSDHFFLMSGKLHFPDAQRRRPSESPTDKNFSQGYFLWYLQGFWSFMSYISVVSALCYVVAFALGPGKRSTHLFKSFWLIGCLFHK